MTGTGTVRVIYREEPDGAWIGTSPEVPGFVGHGDTYEEARDRVNDGLGWFAGRDVVIAHVLPTRGAAVRPRRPHARPQGQLCHDQGGMMLPDALRPYAKAALPAALTLVAVLGQVVATGTIDRAALATALTGLLGALVTLLASNGPAVHEHAGEPVDDDGRTTLGTDLRHVS